MLSVHAQADGFAACESWIGPDGYGLCRREPYNCKSARAAEAICRAALMAVEEVKHWEEVL